MDSYITRFESYALSNKWDPSMWASYLSALLKGRALEVFDRLSRDDQSDYGQIKVRNLGIVGQRKPKLSDNLAVG